MQRLGRDANKLVSQPDRDVEDKHDQLNLVSGHELDWLAFEIALLESHEGSSWHIVGTSGYRRGAEETQSSDSKRSDQLNCNDLPRIRTRLAHLTGHHPSHPLDDSECKN